MGGLGTLGYGSMGGMKLGHIGAIPYGHIGGIHAHSLLLAPNPYAEDGNQMLGSTQSDGNMGAYSYQSADEPQAPFVGTAKDDDEPTPPDTPQMPMEPSDSDAFVGSPMPRAQIDVMAAGADDHMPVPTPMLNQDGLVGTYQQDDTGNTADNNLGAPLFRDEDDDEDDGDELVPQVIKIFLLSCSLEKINKNVKFCFTVAW